MDERSTRQTTRPISIPREDALIEQARRRLAARKARLTYTYRYPGDDSPTVPVDITAHIPAPKKEHA